MSFDLIAFIAFLAFGVIYADFFLTRGNMGAVWNGIGCVPDVLRGESKDPMQYRVLVPWLCYAFVGLKDSANGYGATYLRIRWTVIPLCLSVSWIYFASVGVNPFIATALLAMFFVLAALFDYTDVYFEVLFIAAGLLLLGHGSVIALMGVTLIAFIGALNRETIIVLPMVALLQGDLFRAVALGVAAGAGYALPRVYYGVKDRYCSWCMVGANVKLIRDSYRGNRPILVNQYTHFFLLILVTAFLYIRSFMAGELMPVDWAMLAFLGMVLVPSMWREIRVFAPLTLALIPMAVRGL